MQKEYYEYKDFYTHHFIIIFIKYIFNVMYGNHFMIQEMLFSKIKYYVKHFFFYRGTAWTSVTWRVLVT